MNEEEKKIIIKPLEQPKKAQKKAKVKAKLPKQKKIEGKEREQFIKEAEENQQNQEADNQAPKQKRKRGRPATGRKIGPQRALNGGQKIRRTQKQLDVLAMARIALRKKREERKREKQAQFVSPQTMEAEAVQEEVAKQAVYTEDMKLEVDNISANPQRKPLYQTNDKPEPWNIKNDIASNLKTEELRFNRLKIDNNSGFTTSMTNTYTLAGNRSSLGEAGRKEQIKNSQPSYPVLDFL